MAKIDWPRVRAGLVLEGYASDGLGLWRAVHGDMARKEACAALEAVARAAEEAAAAAAVAAAVEEVLPPPPPERPVAKSTRARPLPRKR